MQTVDGDHAITIERNQALNSSRGSCKLSIVEELIIMTFGE